MYRDDIPADANVRVSQNYENCGSQAMASGANPHYRAPSMAELHGKSAAHHAEQVDKNAKAQTFFASHPEFDEFIQLIRQGAIQI